MTSANDRLREALDRADALELRVVHHMVGMTHIRLLRTLTIAVTQLGNGWIYVPIAIAVVLFAHSNASAIVAAAGFAVTCAHLVYAALKRCVARPRPFDRDCTLQPLSRVLDHYSFPSGHCMTLAAVLVPIVWSAPATWPVAAAALGILAWCRIATGHHYPTDILAGIGLGAAISTPLAAWFLSS